MNYSAYSIGRNEIKQQMYMFIELVTLESMVMSMWPCINGITTYDPTELIITMDFQLQSPTTNSNKFPSRAQEMNHNANTNRHHQ